MEKELVYGSMLMIIPGVAVSRSIQEKYPATRSGEISYLYNCNY